MNVQPRSRTARDRPDGTGALAAPWWGGYVDMASPYPGRRLGEILVEDRVLLPTNLDRALRLQAAGERRPLGVILLAEHMVDEAALGRALALQKGVWRAPVAPDAGDVTAIDELGPDLCLRLCCLPLARVPGKPVIVATSRPHLFRRNEAQITAVLGPVRMAVASEDEVMRAILHTHAAPLTELAETRPAIGHSLRGWSRRQMSSTLAGLLAGLAVASVLWPAHAAGALLALAVVTLCAVSALRLAALLAMARRGPDPAPPDVREDLLPRVSLLIPLLRESEISGHLLSHLARLDYPADRLDIVFATETGDTGTETALRKGIPDNARVVTLPRGTVRTKPRALNFALDFARGDIIGVLDAEDAPAPDQLRVIARHFAVAPPEVACLQGRLDFYNPAQNWLARMFAIDYAAWFRVMLPGLARLRIAIPLGGTTVYFRRDVLQRIGRWDAHNVTEDADLGIRLARAGYRTEIARTATGEEANCALRSWVRQRSRWLKGYALTWAVHMRAPVALWRELGTRSFLGFQVLFLGTILSFLLAPLLWTFWLVPLGLPHPVAEMLPEGALSVLVGFFILSELLAWSVAFLGLRRGGDRWLIPWIPMTLLYFPLAALASYRALLSVAVAPFHWDKTAHGLSRKLVSPGRGGDGTDS